MTINKRIEQIKIHYFGDKRGNHKKFIEKVGAKSNEASNWMTDGYSVGSEVVKRILSAFPDVSHGWLLTGEGSMLKDNITTDTRHLIPFFDDVATFGGTEITADVETAHSHATEFIDAGDWFRDATAAIRHCGNSMVEYPSGCILALREVQDRRLIIPGRDYTIETSEYRVTKRLQKGKTDDYVTAYSTNLETYPDGRQIHEPFDIPWSSIRRIYAVLGYVVKKNGGTFVFSNNGRR